MHVLLGPRHFRDVDQALDARLKFDERAVVGDVGDAAGETGVERILRLDALPRIVQQLLHAERDAVGLVVDLDDLDLDGLADGQDLGRVIDPSPGYIGDMQEAVDAAEINERPVIGDVLDDAVDDLTLFEVLHQLLALFGAGLFQNRAARHHDVAAAAIHLEDLERLGVVHQGGDIANRADIDLRTRQEGHRAIEIDGEAALDLIEDDAVHLLIVVEGLLELAPAFLAARLVARQHGFAERILDAVEKHLDLVTDLEIAFAAGPGEFSQRHAAFGLQADVDDGHVFLDRDNLALDDGAFLQVAAPEGLVEHGGKIFTGRIIGISSRSHLFSRCGDSPAIRVKGRYRTRRVRVPQTLTTASQVFARAGRQLACTFDTLIFSGTLSLSISKPGAGFPPMTAEDQTFCRPARTASTMSMAARTPPSISRLELSSK